MPLAPLVVLFLVQLASIGLAPSDAAPAPDEVMPFEVNSDEYIIDSSGSSYVLVDPYRTAPKRKDLIKSPMKFGKRGSVFGDAALSDMAAADVGQMMPSAGGDRRVGGSLPAQFGNVLRFPMKMGKRKDTLKTPMKFGKKDSPGY